MIGREAEAGDEQQEHEHQAGVFGENAAPADQGRVAAHAKRDAGACGGICVPWIIERFSAATWYSPPATRREARAGSRHKSSPQTASVPPVTLLHPSPPEPVRVQLRLLGG